jgi:lysophospholipase L1-like esterase
MKWILKSSLVIGLPLILLYAYNYYPIEISVNGIVLKKITYTDFIEDTSDIPIIRNTTSAPNTIADSTISNGLNHSKLLPVAVEGVDINDTLKYKNSQYLANKDKLSDVDSNVTSHLKLGIPDSSQQRILFIGDSQAGGMASVLNDYCSENGHKLVATFTWYSATIFNFGYSNKVDDLIEKYQPTLIMVVIGLNELYAKDLKKRTAAANLLRAKIGSIPYLWIGPANYTEDYGINQVFEQTATSNRFVLSKHLNLPKASDKRHPNRDGYRIWMEHIARFIQSSDLYNFKFEIPKKFGYRISGKIISCNAAKERGY